MQRGQDISRWATSSASVSRVFRAHEQDGQHCAASLVWVRGGGAPHEASSGSPPVCSAHRRHISLQFLSSNTAG